MSASLEIQVHESDATSSASELTDAFQQRLAAFPASRVNIAPSRVIGYREAKVATDVGAADSLAVVLLHGIGSSAASWVQQLEALSGRRRVLAWDAPGYGDSTPLSSETPHAVQYADTLRQWLDIVGIRHCVLVGHSLGAIMAGAFASTHPARLAGMLLISPAAGYGAAPEAERAQKRDSRLAMLNTLGPRGLAGQRSGNMVSSEASEAARAWVHWNMARVIPRGYAQATHLLANAYLPKDLASYDGRVAVAVGADDKITPPAACERVALAAHARLQIIPHAGHAGYVENPDGYSRLIADFCEACDRRRGLL